MTPILQRIVDLWTCPHCLGNGRLTSSRANHLGGGHYERFTSTQDCAPCQGTGVRDASPDLVPGLL